VVINNVKENRIKSTTIHHGLSRNIKPSEPPGCLVRRPDPRAPLFLSAWNAFRRAPPQSNRNIGGLTFGYDFVNFNFGTESAPALGSPVLPVPGRLITRIASSHGAQANWVAWIQNANGFACSRTRPNASNEGTAIMLMEICSKLPAADR
jgi:hypothetical protein